MNKVSNDKAGVPRNSIKSDGFGIDPRSNPMAFAKECERMTDGPTRTRTEVEYNLNEKMGTVEREMTREEILRFKEQQLASKITEMSAALEMQTTLNGKLHNEVNRLHSENVRLERECDIQKNRCTEVLKLLDSTSHQMNQQREISTTLERVITSALSSATKSY